MNTLEFLKNKFPQDFYSAELLAGYFQRISLYLEKEKFGEDKLKEVFILMMKDYMKMLLDPDQLAVLCGKLFMLVENDSVRRSDIGSLVLRMGELDWQLRNDLDRARELLDKSIGLVKI